MRYSNVTGSVMANHRSIPDDRRWLANALRRIGHVVDCEDDREVERVCNSLDTGQWAKLKAAYRVYSKRNGDAFARQRNQHYSNTRTLGAVWERLIAMKCVTREDAETLASSMKGLLDGAGFADPFARNIVRDSLAQAAKQARKRKPDQAAIDKSIVENARKLHPGLTDVEIAIQMNLPVSMFLASR